MYAAECMLLNVCQAAAFAERAGLRVYCRVKAAVMEDTEEAETVDTVEAEMVDTVEVEEAAMEAAIETTEIMAVMMAGRPPSFEELFCVTGVEVTERIY